MKLIVLLGLFFGLSFNTEAQIFLKNNAAVQINPANLTKEKDVLYFIAMGDWGRNGADHQKPVAQQMGKVASAVKAQFIIATGDNFYPSGVVSEFDPLFKYSFEDIYTDFSLQWDWYPVLGNHDYGTNPDAEVAYSKISRRWKMPARYYSKKFSIAGDSTQQVLIAFIDTNPLIPEYYKNADMGPNVKKADSLAQKNWLIKTLSDASPNIKWKIVVGHHPPYTGGGRTENYDTKAMRKWLKPIFDQYGVDAYLSGHEHSLQHLKPKGKTHYFISGAASEKTPVKLIPEAEMVASEYGFMLFGLSKDELKMQSINEKGETIYQTVIKK